MIKENTQPEEEKEAEDRNKTFYSDDLLKAMYIMLTQCGGMVATRHLLDQVPKNYLEQIKCGYDENLRGLRIQVERPRKRGIIKPGKKIITLN